MLYSRIKELRTENNKTQEQVANFLSCKREVYRRYEKGIREIPAWMVIKLARYYETSTDYVLGVSDEK